MILKRLRVAHLRAFSEEAELSFQPGMNLLVGVNGVGKSTALDALRVLLSQMLPKISESRATPLMFDTDDITVGCGFLDAELSCEVDGLSFSYIRHEPREAHLPDVGREGDVRHQVINTPQRSEWLFEDPVIDGPQYLRRHLENKGISPLAVYYSAQRSVLDESAAKVESTRGGMAAAFAEGLRDRRISVQECASWIRVQHALSPIFQERLNALVRTFLDECDNLRVITRSGKKEEHHLFLDKRGVPLNVRQLSEGERGLLALVLDLTLRLDRANPNLENPARDGRATVLIDELDLHLHPKWQRTVVTRLTQAFPNCQFVATTHSPQIIGEVERHRIQIITKEQVYSPTHSFGVDSSRVLEEIMDSTQRTTQTQELLTQFSRAVRKEDYDAARKLMSDLAGILGENDPEVTRGRTLLEFIENDR